MERLRRFELPKACRIAASLRCRIESAPSAHEVGSSNTGKCEKPVRPEWDKPVFGAAGQIRTADLVITKTINLILYDTRSC